MIVTVTWLIADINVDYTFFDTILHSGFASPKQQILHALLSNTAVF